MDLDAPPNRAKENYQWRFHHTRYKRHISNMPRKLVCQACGGAGGEVEPVTDYGEGPFMSCGFCEGTGYVTRWMRGQWLRWKKSGEI